jgi:hypothetical protein
MKTLAVSTSRLHASAQTVIAGQWTEKCRVANNGLRVEVETEEFRVNMRHVPRRWRAKKIYQN